MGPRRRLFANPAILQLWGAGSDAACAPLPSTGAKLWFGGSAPGSQRQQARARERLVGPLVWLVPEHLNETLDAVFELLYDPTSVIVRGGSVGAYDDDALQALVAMLSSTISSWFCASPTIAAACSARS